MDFSPLFFLFFFVSTAASADVLDISGAARCVNTTAFLHKLLDFKKLLVPFPAGFSINYRPLAGGQKLANGTVVNVCKVRGQLECDLGKYQACAKAFMTTDYLPVISCMQGLPNSAAAGKCVEASGEKQAVVQRIKTCGSSAEGDKLLREEQATRPKGINAAPWVQINGVRVPDAEYNPRKYICQLTSVKNHKACQ